ncbi:MaoC family dehydratase [Streptomyces cylindrosporus]|uniref:MaoC family dehydratase n=1 Tax=Streptomyces cylindrosporus TaxID=2927583 RepID=A0ABS9Y8A5_9ACTN|nr:MaoC family dehydratase [Streptomyces cylindrosporus]MCI3273457.1 MaoC family dehydratase [Streptomyces cylindrosporus]
MKIYRNLAEWETALGTHIGHSDWYTVTQDEVNLFAEATGDHQWIHVDPVRAKDGPFDGTIVHGYFTLSLIPGLVWQVFRVDGIEMSMNYGTDKVRFPAPLPVGARIRAGVELVALEPRAGGVQEVLRVTVEREGGDKPVCVADTVSLLFPATPAVPATPVAPAGTNDVGSRP